MLTYYHYLLSGLFAATCAASTLVGSITASPPLTRSTPTDADSTETLDVSYRGSGRVDDVPKEQRSSQKKLVAHRGSGRIEPAPM